MIENYVITGKLNAFDQLNLVRKLAPALPLIDIQLKEENKDKPKALLLVMGLSNLSDKDSEFVVNKCLSCVSRKQTDGTLAKVQTKEGILMFDDISVMDMVELTALVIDRFLGDFLRTALANSEVDQDQI